MVRNLLRDRRGGASIHALGELDPDHGAAHLGLQLIRRPFGDLATAVDYGDPVGEFVGLVEVLGGQKDRAAICDQAPDRLPHLTPGSRVEPGGWFVEEDERGLGDEAGGEVKSTSHATRVLREAPVGRLGQVELRQQVVGRAMGLLR